MHVIVILIMVIDLEHQHCSVRNGFRALMEHLRINV